MEMIQLTKIILKEELNDLIRFIGGSVISKKTGWLLNIIQSVAMFILVIWFRFYRYDIEDAMTFFLMPFIYIGVGGMQLLSIFSAIGYALFSKEKTDIKKYIPFFVNLFLQFILFFGLTEANIEKMKFDLYLKQRNQVVSDIENKKLCADSDGKIDLGVNEQYKNLSINDEAKIVQFDEDMYVWFYTAIYMEGESTGCFYLMKSSDNVTAEKVEFCAITDYGGGWCKGTMIEE